MRRLSPQKALDVVCQDQRVAKVVADAAPPGHFTWTPQHPTIDELESVVH